MERDVCVHTYIHIHIDSMSAFVWAMRIVEMVVHTSTTSYKLITTLKAHCNIKYVYDGVPIES